jgi:hypothetical protein
MTKRPATDYRYNISYITKQPTTCQVKRICRCEPHTQPTRYTQPTPTVFIPNNSSVDDAVDALLALSLL